MQGIRSWAAYRLRLPQELRDKIKIEAARNRRSMNAEIVIHLERSFGDTAETK